MKRILTLVLFLVTLSAVSCGSVPRVAFQFPPQAHVLIYPPLCENVVLPSIPNRGIIYAQVYTHQATMLYMELNGQPLTDESGTVVYYPLYSPKTLEIIPVLIPPEYQRKAAVLTAKAVNDSGTHTVYSAFVPVPAGTGTKTTTFGCTSIY